MNKIIEAAKFAKKAHGVQMRKYTGTPYILHPARVASRATLLDNATEDIICAAWLHDVVEDCPIKLDEIEELFGNDVGILVWELTNPSKGKHLPRDAQKEMDRRHLRLVSTDAKCIKLIDRIDNLGEADNAPEDWFKLYLQESRLLLGVLEGTCKELEDELNFKINTYSRKFGMEI